MNEKVGEASQKTDGIVAGFGKLMEPQNDSVSETQGRIPSDKPEETQKSEKTAEQLQDERNKRAASHERRAWLRWLNPLNHIAPGEFGGPHKLGDPPAPWSRKVKDEANLIRGEQPPKKDGIMDGLGKLMTPQDEK